MALLIAAGLKTWIVTRGLVPFNSDEAVVALMARHILQGQNPVFFYGQAYMGSLDAYLAAIGFWIFGQEVWVIRLVQGLLYLGVILTTVWLARLAYASWWVAAIAALLLAIPTVNMTLYTTASLGGYGEALLIGNFILINTIIIQRYWRQVGLPGKWHHWALLGFLSGLGLWAFGITLVYSAASLIYLGGYLLIKKRYLFERIHSEKPVPTSFARLWIVPFLSLLAGALAGSAPWWGFALQSGFNQLVRELGGGAIAGVEQSAWIVQVWQHFLNLILLGSTAAFGFRPPWEVAWLALPLIPFVLFFWIIVTVLVIKEIFQKDGNDNSKTSAPGIETKWMHCLFILVILILLTAFVLSPFGADPSGRYFVPLAVPSVLLAGWSVVKLRDRIGWIAYALLGVILVFNFWGTVQCAQRFPPGFTTQFYKPAQIDHRFDQALMDFLQQEGESYGYGNYWVTYPLAFLSQESLIYVPALPYHPDFRYTQRDDRYAPYRARVASAPRVAYITTHHPQLDEKLRREFIARQITWQEKTIGDYRIFYRLSDLIQPQEMGLGITTDP